MKKFDVSEYWEKRGSTYKNELDSQSRLQKKRLLDQEEFLVNLLAKYNFKNILEIGCGSGRYTKILSSKFNPERYLAIDISEKQIENARKYVSNERIEFLCTKIQDFNTNEKFDLVFCSEVLMHINFEDINALIKKLVSFSNNLIVSIDWYDKKKIGKNNLGYCFMHDYEVLFKGMGVKKIMTYKIPLSLQLRIVDIYARLRRRTGIDSQAVMMVFR